MWTDNEAEKDYLNFGSVAKTVAEIIVQAQSRPISIGVSGAWGVGKSSMIRLIENELQCRDEVENRKYVFVKFNAWLYQGYDDARAALIEVVASTLAKEAKERETCLDKVSSLLERVNWFRALKLTASSAASLAVGLPPTGLLAEIYGAIKGVTDEDITQADIDAVGVVGDKVSKKTNGILSPKAKTPPKEIEELRKSFESILGEMGVTLVVLIDDLDRCLPETTISTLEAIRLLLFLKNTAFVIAADDQMIKHAVKKHFHNVEDDLVTSYFDKLIQVPIRVPPLGTQEVRSYMMLLFVQNSKLSTERQENIRLAICEQLSKSWQGCRVDLKFIRKVDEDLPQELMTQLDTADRLAPLMTTALGISGNPRLIKRFMNALSIRMAMSRAQGVGVDESVLAKILLFERCGNPKAYAELIKTVTESEDGKSGLIAELEEKVTSGEHIAFEAPWDQDFVAQWLKLPPSLGQIDLRGALYVSREHAPLIMPEDQLSPEAIEMLQALLDFPDMASSYKERLCALPRNEISVMMDRALEKARQEQEWGVPDILDACIVLSRVDASQGERLAGFLKDRPGAQIKPSIVPKIADESWSKSVLDYWSDDDDVSVPVRKAVQKELGR
ncbi:KAP family P-loop NTPase fold protein [Vibrio parahaemolyticus]|uniref:KAP family P-loop NTPase fold protein n=1 Tax=Vibrio parahaemolyticus TaxID=670 RepID=UPI000942E623|nr:P-loop NTPase fold protein [Vibrio parahaemolyticus]MCX8946786.1 P-loop NTPase fold protein [Vibrio parahaemolyticus]OKY43500.1 ATPase [Vibrio parahaemolyticus]